MIFVKVFIPLYLWSSGMLTFLSRVLSNFAFNLTIDWELSKKKKIIEEIRENVQEMLIKHHLFSWLIDS